MLRLPRAVAVQGGGDVLQSHGDGVEGDAGVAQGVVHGVEDGGGGTDRDALPHSFGAGATEGARGLEVLDFDDRDLVGGRDEVVHERGAGGVAGLVVGDRLVERGGDPLGDPAAHLAVDDARVDHDAAV